MRLSPVALLLFFAGILPVAAASGPEELIEDLKKAAHSETRNSHAAIEGVLEAGPAVIPLLLPLLSHDDKEVRLLASWAVSEIKGLTDEHLDILIQAYRNGLRLVGSGIVRIASPRAVDFVVETLISDPHSGQGLLIENAPFLLGEKLLPGLVQFYQSDREWDDGVETRMIHVFNLLRIRHTPTKSAIGPLLEMANDKAISVKRHVRAIVALGAIGVSIEGEVASLQTLQKSEGNEIRDAVLEALAFISVADAVERVDQIRKLAEQGTLAKYAGPDLVKDLQAEDWDVRVAAARAIGYVGFEDAIDALVPLLQRNDDWRVAYSAAESLGRLRAKKAVPVLEAVAKEYWYPPVREAATRAIGAIDGLVAQESEPPAKYFFVDEFSGYDRGQTDWDFLAEKEARFIRFPVAVRPEDLFTIIVKKPSAWTPEKMRGVKVDDGHLVGSDQGEWGGRITYVNREGKSRMLLPLNTEAIYKTKAGIVAVTGVAHMTYNEGCLFRIGKAADGHWSAQKWRVLPGAPRFSRLLKDGNLFVSCHGGIAMISRDGEMRSLKRHESGVFAPAREPTPIQLKDIPEAPK